jgi:hypothetical protein
LVEIRATSRHGLVAKASYRQATTHTPERTLRVILAIDEPFQVLKATVY